MLKLVNTDILRPNRYILISLEFNAYLKGTHMTPNSPHSTRAIRGGGLQDRWRLKT